VVKPAVSASARDTWKATRADAHESEASFRELAAAGDVLVQPFVREVTSDGEWSLLFYGGVYSHAVRKRPRAGDFRVQTAHGGSAVAEEPDARVIAQAREALRAAPAPLGELLYARVDGCMIGDRFVLMELELVEPELFLGMHPAAADRLAAHVSADARA
jgi:glutathione synthase/RimK-type ligase-like ATP-grasp enzyme